MTRDLNHPTERARGSRPSGPTLLLFTLVFLLGSCGSEPKRKEGESCGKDSPCGRGLRCSVKKKRCYRPVDCKRLETRLDRCLKEIVFTFEPRARKLEPARRVKVLKKISSAIADDVVNACRYDARAYRRKHGQEPPQKRSRGEDVLSKEINACLKKDACPEFARCILGVARLQGKKRPDPKGKKVFPLPKPLRPPRSDGGLSTTVTAPADKTGGKTKAEDAHKQPETIPAMKPAEKPDPRPKAMATPKETPRRMAPPPPRIR